MLQGALQIHGDKDWVANAALVPGRTQKQCDQRWHDVLDPSISQVARRTGKWTEYEDLKLKNSGQMHGDKDWVQICTLVPSRTRK
jgi:myb proto-oncogene protein